MEYKNKVAIVTGAVPLLRQGRIHHRREHLYRRWHDPADDLPWRPWLDVNRVNDKTGVWQSTQTSMRTGILGTDAPRSVPGASTAMYIGKTRCTAVRCRAKNVVRRAVSISPSSASVTSHRRLRAARWYSPVSLPTSCSLMPTSGVRSAGL